MGSLITPNPSIHTDPTAKSDAQAAAQSALASLRSMLSAVPGEIIQLIVNAILNALGLSTIEGPVDQVLSRLESGLGGAIEGIPAAIVDALGGSSVGKTFAELLADAETALTNVITNVSPLNAAQLSANLWPQGLFPDAGSIAGAGVWVFDPDVTHTTDSTGAVRVTADGTIKALRGVPTTVVAGQQTEVSVFVQWSDYSGTAAPIQLQIAQYLQADGAVTLVGISTVSTLGPTTATGGWAELSGTFTVPSGVNLIRGRLVVTDGAAAGTIWFDDASATNELLASSISGLLGQLQGIQAGVQAVIDTAIQAVTGVTSVGNTLNDLLSALSNILPESVSGVLGPGTIGQTVQQFVDALLSGLTGILGTGAGFSDVQTVANQVSSNAGLGASSWQVLGIRDNTSTSSGFLPSGRSNFDLTAAAFQSAAPAIAVTQAASAICYDRVSVSQPLGVISWLGYGVSGVTAFYINVWQIQSDGSASLIHHSPNIVGSLASATGTTPIFLFYTLSTPLAQVATEQYLYEYVPVGGTHHMVGQTTGSWLPSHPTAAVSQYGYTRDNTSAPNSPPTSITKADLVGADTVPWTEVAINDGSSTGDTYADVEIYFTQGGTSPIPAWANYIDVIVLGHGGDGADGIIGFYGNPGTPGAFNSTTWARDTHFTDPATIITFAGSAVSIPGYTVTASDGVDGSGTILALLGEPIGHGPGTFEYHSVQAIGGADQTVFGGAGATPGGAGNGGRALGLYTAGGLGAPSAAWLQFRQDPLSGETAGSGTGDAAAPDAPTLSLIGVTQSTITVTTLGGYPPPTADPTGISSAESFGDLEVFVYAPPGDSDGTTEIPHKVPYTI